MSKTRNTSSNVIRALKIGVGFATAVLGTGVAIRCIREYRSSDGYAKAILGPGFASGALLGTATAYSGAHVAHAALKQRPARPMEKFITGAVAVSAVGMYGVVKLDEHLSGRRFSKLPQSKPQPATLPAPKTPKP